MARSSVFLLLMLPMLAALTGVGALSGEDATLEVTVTSAEDPAEGAACPDDEACSLRAAIALVNADEAAEKYTIRFDLPSADEQPVIRLQAPLPAIARDNVSVLGEGRVVVDGSALEEAAPGITLAGEGARLEGVTLHAFGGACVAVNGADARIHAVHVTGCETGIAAHGANTTITASRVGLDRDEGMPEMATGIDVRAPGVTIGGSNAHDGNTIGGAAIGVRVGGGGAAFAGTRIENNSIGRDGDEPAQVAIGVQIRPPASGSTVARNDFAHTELAAIQVAGGEPVSVGNTFRENRFQLREGMAIDLGADGVRNPNHGGEPNHGPNRMQNHPVFTRPTQAGIWGSVAGCGADCRVELYEAEPTEPGTWQPTLPIGATTTDVSGQFLFEAPPVVPGQYVMATATDGDGNTSEFGPSARVGTGVVQCGNVVLRTGWNLVGYFGPGPLSLGETFPGADGERVRAVYQLRNGTGKYDHWIQATPVARTLETLNPGEAYWFLADGTVTLPYGFSLGVGLPVALAPGLNSFVYIGGSGDANEVLADLAGSSTTVYRWSNDGTVNEWQSFAPDAPGYANEFETLEACQAYMILLDEAGVLIPLQP